MEYTVTYVEQLVAKYKAMGDKLIDKITPRIKITHSHRKSTVGGYAYFKEWRILLNVPLLRFHPEEIEQTVGHEVAHLFANKLDMYCRHGRTWKDVMRCFGLDPRRCHNMEASVLVGKRSNFRYRYTLKCKDCGLVMHYNTNQEIKDHNNTSLSHLSCRRSGLNRGAAVVIGMKTKEQFVAELLDRKAVVQEKAACAASSAPTPSGLTKKEQAEKIFNQNRHLGRKAVIQMFIDQMSMTTAGSATYYANCKKKFG